MIGHRPVDQSSIPMCCLSFSVRFYTSVSLTCVHYKIMPTSVLADHTILFPSGAGTGKSRHAAELHKAIYKKQVLQWHMF